jgi:hypothetical protein
MHNTNDRGVNGSGRVANIFNIISIQVRPGQEKANLTQLTQKASRYSCNSIFFSMYVPSLIPVTTIFSVITFTIVTHTRA